MITVRSVDHRLHQGQHELIDGQLRSPFETSERVERVLARVEEVHLGDVVDALDFGLEPVERVHSRRYLEFLRHAYQQWREAHKECDALPLCWPNRSLRQREPDDIDGKLGYYSFDAGTPITEGTWLAALSSANVALTGASRLREGDRAAFALCRPPGHHASRDLYGGYCFLNNAAIAAQSLLDGGAERVAILDIDYHHGNGTQTIFYDRPDVLFASLHAHPSQDYPYFLGYSDETGAGHGVGMNLNLPMRWGTDWATWSEALDVGLARIRDFAPEALIVSLGVDTYVGDPLSHFKLKTHHYPLVGARIAHIGCPTLFVMEGGYALDVIGTNVSNVLVGFAQE